MAPEALSASVNDSPEDSTVKAIPGCVEPVTSRGKKACVAEPPPSMPSDDAPWHQMAPRLVSAQSCALFIDTSAHWLPTAYSAGYKEEGRVMVKGLALSIKRRDRVGVVDEVPKQYMANILSMAHDEVTPTAILIHLAKAPVGLCATVAKVVKPG